MATNDTKMAAGDIIWSPTIQYGYRLYKMAVGDTKMAISNTKPPQTIIKGTKQTLEMKI